MSRRRSRIRERPGRPVVLVAHPSADVYGSDRQLLESIGGLRDAGWCVELVVPERGPLLDLLDTEPRIAPFPVLRKAMLRPAPLLLAVLRTPLHVLHLVRVIRSIAPDVVYVNTITIPWWVIAARCARVPVLVHVHEAEERSRQRVRKLLYAPLLVAQGVIANSSTTRRVVLQSHARLEDRVRVIANGIPDVGPQPRSGIERGRIALVSRLSPRKGIDVAIDALARLRDREFPVTLQICGTPYAGYEWYEAKLRRQVDDLGLRDRVTFAGYVAPSRQALLAAEVVIVPSLGESFGNVAVEGMLAERPVIASGVQALAEIIDDGRTGLLVPPGDATALAGAIEKVLDDGGLAVRLAEAGRIEAISRFSVSRYREQIARLASETVR